MKLYILLLFLLLVGMALVFYRVASQPVKVDNPDTLMVDFLQQYIRINTSHPKPNYKAACSFLMDKAITDGFSAQEVKLPSGYSAVIISYTGKNPSLPSVALNHHMDVVPATNTQEWASPPFAAEIHNDAIIGRGTQDMKGIGAVHYYALKSLKDAGIRPRRTVHLLVVPDEEVGGFKGTKLLVQSDEFKKLNIDTVVDEGVASGDEGLLLLKLTERRPIQIEVTAKGQLAHGSHLTCHNATHYLVDFLGHLVGLHKQSQYTAQELQPGLLPSYNITSLTAGSTATLNVVPAWAKATVDIRIPPNMSLQEVIEDLNVSIKKHPSLTYTIKAMATEKSIEGLEKSLLYAKLEKACLKNGLKVIPHHFEASSDLRFYHALGIEGIGLTPFTCHENLHGTNESVPIKDLIRGRNIFIELLKSL